MANLGTTINLGNFQMLQKFESLELREQICALLDMLEAQGYTDVERKGARSSIMNYFYSRDNCDYVFAVIHKKEEKEIFYAFMDKRTYVECIEARKGVILNNCVRNMKDYKIILSGDKWDNEMLHKVALEGEKDNVDHISHNAAINIKELLRPCSAKENSMNKPLHCKVAKNKLLFRVNKNLVKADDYKFLHDNDFEFTVSKVISPTYTTKEELYAAINKFEEKCFGEFRYNPLKDFSETWYALVICKMLGVLTEDELYEYNRQYMRRWHKDIAEYYQL